MSRSRLYHDNAARQRAYRERKRNGQQDGNVTLYYEDEWVKLYHGDSSRLLPRLASGSIDLILTDPPYNVSMEGGDILYTSGTLAQRRDFGRWDYEWSPDVLLRESARLLTPGGSLLSFTSDRLLSDYCRAVPGLKYRGTRTWAKTNAPPSFRPGYIHATEYIAWLARDGAGATWNGGGSTLNYSQLPSCGGAERSEHPTQKPLRLIKELLRLHSNAGDMVLDPFAGSGTTLAAAKLMGRRAIGVELNERYCEIAAQRLCQHIMDLDAA